LTRRTKVLALAATAAAVVVVVVIALVIVLPNGVFSSKEGQTHSSGSAAAAGCTLMAAGSLDAAAGKVNGAPPGAVVCLHAGNYTGTLSLEARHAGDVTLEAAPGAHVTTGTIDIGGSHLIVRGLWIHGELALAPGASHIAVEHDDISGGGEGVVFDTSDCTAPNAPSWPGCRPLEPIADVIISGNHFHNIGQAQTEDAIHLDNWRSVTVSNNEFDHIVESGNHTDCLQSVYGGSELTFTHNYEHDNDCQGIFVKDGDATDVSVTENLFLRDNESDVAGAHFSNLAQLWNVQGLTFEHNTIWDGKGLVLAAEDAHNSPSARIDHNLFSGLTVSKPIGRPYALSESYNVFGQPPWSFVPSATDRTIARPRFLDTAREDYRLANDPNGIGIDWSPAAERYGPAG
jgi:hypothetical protein